MTSELRTIQILDPCPEESAEELGLSSPVPDLRGKVVGILENRKYHADAFLQELQEVLLNNYGVERVVYATKFTYSAASPNEALNALTDECDVVVHGVAD